MTPFVLLVADGTAFFVGLALVFIATTLFLRFRKGVVHAVLLAFVLVGMLLVAISATPLPIWAYLVWATIAFAGLILGNRGEPSKPLNCITGIALLLTTVGLCLAEAPYHRRPHLTVANGKTIYVLGDSISAGTIGSKLCCWPMVLKGIVPFRVVNLAQGAATVERAIGQAKGITEPNSVVIVEVGGNDMIGGTDAAGFRSRYHYLVSSLRAAGHQVLIFELPLFPFQNAYGEAQRSAVTKYGVSMLPKRCFAKVLGTTNATLDGIHLSQEGHNALAKIIAAVITKEENRSAPTSSTASEENLK